MPKPEFLFRDTHSFYWCCYCFFFCRQKGLCVMRERSFLLCVLLLFLMIINYLNGLSVRLDKERFLPFLFSLIPFHQSKWQEWIDASAIKWWQWWKETGFIYLLFGIAPSRVNFIHIPSHYLMHAEHIFCIGFNVIFISHLKKNWSLATGHHCSMFNGPMYVKIISREYKLVFSFRCQSMASG